MPQFLFESLHHALAVTAFIHIDEVDDDDASEIAQPDLPDNLLNSIYVRFHDRIFETRSFADILAGVDVDRD